MLRTSISNLSKFLGLTVALYSATVSFCQNQSADKQKHWSFEVVTIKPSNAGEHWHYGFGKTGYSAAGVSLRTVIYQAYFPRNMSAKDPIVNIPDWVSKDKWDIEAKVATEDMPEYERQRSQNFAGNPMYQDLLQSMLADRCKLVVHRVPATMPGFAIVLAKGGANLHEAAPDEAQPSGSIPLASGGYIVPYKRGERPKVDYYAASMSAFAEQLRGFAGRPVIDRTGLKGKYDLSLVWLSSGSDEREGYIDFDDPFPLSHWNFAALGLKVESIQLPTELVSVDHIEKPSEN